MNQNTHKERLFCSIASKTYMRVFGKKKTKQHFEIDLLERYIYFGNFLALLL
jgi:hypothetical protein